jgi:hypothetical protein
MFYPKFYRRYFILTIGLAIASIFFASCTPKPNSSTGQLVSQSTKTAVLKVGSRNTTTEDVLKFIQKEIVSSQGLDFQIVTIADSVKINDALKSGEIDANFFQHEPVQGWPVIVQAGASEAGRQLAAETAEAVFAPAGNLEAGKALFADIKGRARAIGRDPDSIKILPGALVIVGETVAEAYAKRLHLDSLVHYDSGIASLNSALGYDVSGFDPDGPLPEIPSTNAGHSSRERVIALAQRENLTIRQLAQRIGSYGGLAFVGTPQSIADEMEQWLIEEGSDGFNIMFPFLPEGLNDFVDKVVPELQRRGIFRKEYEGNTLRENLGLARPANRFFQTSLV